MPSTTQSHQSFVPFLEFLDNITRDKTGGSSSRLTVDADTYWYINLINVVTLGQVFAIFGVTTNLVNIVVFINMGFRESINISLLGLSISDFLSCLPLLWMNSTRTPGFADLDLPFDPFGTGYITGSWPHFTFVKITSCITAFITMERCLCVVFPFKVKDLMTPTTVAFITVGLYVTVLAFALPTLCLNPLVTVFQPKRNKTILSLVATEGFIQIEPFSFIVFGMILPFASFFATILFTIVLVVTLKTTTSWRNKVTANRSKTPGNVAASSREVKVSRMVTMISCVFIACFSPIMVATFFVFAYPEFQKVDASANIMFVIFSFIYLLETTNASLNIFIYYHGSSNYMATFDRIFKKKTR